jgi:hypothetical protein
MRQGRGEMKMPGLANWWCQLFGYVDCKALSTFEAIIFAVVTLIVLLILVSVVAGIISAGR